jgi:hypothetical protein
VIVHEILVDMSEKVERQIAELEQANLVILDLQAKLKTQVQANMLLRQANERLAAELKVADG